MLGLVPYTKNYTQDLHLVVSYFWIATDLSINFRAYSLVPGRSYDSPIANELTLCSDDGLSPFGHQSLNQPSTIV